MINSDLKNCFLKLAAIVERCGVSTYKPAAALLEQNQELAVTMFDYRKYSEYLADWITNVAGALNESDTEIFGHCLDYLKSGTVPALEENVDGRV